MTYNINDITHDVNTQDTLNKSILDDYKRLIEAMQERNFFVTQQARGYKRLDTLAQTISISKSKKNIEKKLLNNNSIILIMEGYNMILLLLVAMTCGLGSLLIAMGIIGLLRANKQAFKKTGRKMTL